jgi:hypothetical protein
MAACMLLGLLNLQQRSLLGDNVVSVVKPGCKIVYGLCSLITFSIRAECAERHQWFEMPR